MQNEEFIKEFIEEALGHIETIEEDLLKLEQGHSDKEIVNGLFRAVHSIKGTAGFFGLKKIVSLSHTMENLLGECRNGRLSPTPSMVDILLRANDQLKTMVTQADVSDQHDIGHLVEALSSFLEVQEAIQGEAAKTESVTLKDSLRHGHKVYHLQVALASELPTVSPVAFFKSLHSIGNVLWVDIDTSAITGLEASLSSDIYVHVLFSTVLTRDLALQALGAEKLKLSEVKVEGQTDVEALAKRVRNGEFAPTETAGKKKASAAGTPASGPTATTSGSSAGSAMEENVRVNVRLLNKLLSLASEMVLGRNQLLRLTQGVRKSTPGLEQVLQDIDHLTTELQESIMQTRMQPLHNVFNKFPRIVRDLSKALDKQVNLTVEGADVELDKSIIESLTDPLTHLIRNALDHGMEKPSERGDKPETGLLILRAYHEGGKVNIDVSDDGRGIDPEKVKAKALKNGLLSATQAAQMGEAELVQLIFGAGFSTAEKLSDVSGRGVGLDVVKTNIDALGGSVEVFSTKGKGSTFRLVLPLTVAIIPSLVAEVEGQRFAVPQVNIKGIVRVVPGDSTRRIEYVDDSPVLKLRGNLLPIIDFASLLGFERRLVNKAEPMAQSKSVTLVNKRAQKEAAAAREESYRRDEVRRVVVLKSGQKNYGLLVDKIYDSEEVLIKPLPKYIGNYHVFSGATIMGDGKVALILDPDGVADQAGLRFHDNSAAQQTAADAKIIEQDNRRNLLLFTAAGPESFAVDLSEVARVEKVSASDIEVVGNREFAKIGGQAMRILRPEGYLPVKPGDWSSQTRYIIVPKGKRTGIMAERVNDTYLDTIKLDTESLKAEGLQGTALIRGKMVLVIDMPVLVELGEKDKTRVLDISSLTDVSRKKRKRGEVGN